MKYTTSGNCPYCDSERGINTPWGMHPYAMQQLKEEHDNHHPQNQPQSLTGKFITCPKCNFILKER